jgi:hypothetical protein
MSCDFIDIRQSAVQKYVVNKVDVNKGIQTVENNKQILECKPVNINTTFDWERSAKATFAYLARNETPQKTEAKPSSFRGILFGINRLMSKLHHPSGEKSASHHSPADP